MDFKTIDIINKYSDKPWDWGWISHNPNITLDFINKHPDKPWGWSSMFMIRNPAITFDLINKFLSKNPAITYNRHNKCLNNISPYVPRWILEHPMINSKELFHHHSEECVL